MLQMIDVCLVDSKLKVLAPGNSFVIAKPFS